MRIRYPHDASMLKRIQQLQMSVILVIMPTHDQFIERLSICERVVFGVLNCNLNRVVDRERLMCALYSDEGPWPNSNCLQIFVGRIRKKLHGQVTIDAVSGIGYVMQLRNSQV